MIEICLCILGIAAMWSGTELLIISGDEIGWVRYTSIVLGTTGILGGAFLFLTSIP